MNKNNSPLKVVLQAVIDKVRSLANIRAAVKAFETALPKIKADVDTETAVKKVKKLGKQKTNMVIQTRVDNSQIAPAIKEAQKETQTLWQRFSEGLSGINLIQLGLQKVVQSIRQAVAGIKELDTVKTAIQMAAGASDYEADIMIRNYNSIAKELSMTTKDTAKTAIELLRLGESTASWIKIAK